MDTMTRMIVTLISMSLSDILVLWLIFAATWLEERNGVLDSGCTDHMTRDKDMFRELAENDGPRKYVAFGDNSKGKVVGLGKVAISHDRSIQNVMLIESLGYNLLSISRLADFGFNVLFTKVDC